MQREQNGNQQYGSERELQYSHFDIADVDARKDDPEQHTGKSNLQQTQNQCPRSPPFLLPRMLARWARPFFVNSSRHSRPQSRRSTRKTLSSRPIEFLNVSLLRSDCALPYSHTAAWGFCVICRNVKIEPL